MNPGHGLNLKAFAALAGLALCSCATQLPPAKPHPPFQENLRVEKSPYELDLKIGISVGRFGGDLPKAMDQYGMRGQTTSVYSLVDTRTGKVVGQAESAITRGRISKGLLSGERQVEISADGQKILVQEDVSDASPSRRYIEFERKSDGTFTTWYLAPPVTPIPDDQVVEFNYSLPWIHFTDPGFAYYPRFPTPLTR